MSYMVCPRCEKSREVYEKIETKDGKTWMITYCMVCRWNWDIEEVNNASTKRKARRFKWGISDDLDSFE